MTERLIIPEGVIMDDLLKHAVKKNIPMEGSREERRFLLRNNQREFTKAFWSLPLNEKNAIIQENKDYKDYG